MSGTSAGGPRLDDLTSDNWTTPAAPGVPDPTPCPLPEAQAPFPMPLPWCPPGHLMPASQAGRGRTDGAHDVMAEYRDAYRRAQAVAAYWVWWALINGRAPDMVPRDCLRPSGRITWVAEGVTSYDSPRLPTDDELAEWDAHAAQFVQAVRAGHAARQLDWDEAP
jgi:hypothetical protein